MTPSTRYVVLSAVPTSTLDTGGASIPLAPPDLYRIGTGGDTIEDAQRLYLDAIAEAGAEQGKEHRSDEEDGDDAEQIEATTDGAYIVEGGMTIRDLNRAHDWQLPDEEANTVAGLVIHEAQMIPVEGQVFSFHGFRFEVIEKEENRIAQIKIRKL